MKKMQYGGKSVPGSTRIKKDGKWVSISDAEAAKMDADRRKKAENSVYRASKPVTILKGVNRKDEIGKPLTPMVVKKPAASAPKPAAPSTKTGGGSKSSPSKIKKPVSFSPGIKSPSSFKNMDTKLKANVSSPKSFADMPRSKSSESNSSTASTASKSSASPLSKRATMKGLRKEKRSERKLTRMDRREDRQDKRENRIINKTAKLKAKR